MKAPEFLAGHTPALVACGVACDAILNDGKSDADVHGFLVIMWRDGQPTKFTSNTDPHQRPAVAKALREVADRLDGVGV